MVEVISFVIVQQVKRDFMLGGVMDFGDLRLKENDFEHVRNKLVRKRIEPVSIKLAKETREVKKLVSKPDNEL